MGDLLPFIVKISDRDVRSKDNITTRIYSFLVSFFIGSWATLLRIRVNKYLWFLSSRAYLYSRDLLYICVYPERIRIWCLTYMRYIWEAALEVEMIRLTVYALLHLKYSTLFNHPSLFLFHEAEKMRVLLLLVFLSFY